VLNSKGKLSAFPVKNYSNANARRVLYIENLNSSILAPGTYQIALVVTNPGGNPANVEDWYNCFAALLDDDAILYSETSISNDYDGDGERDDDYDRDGYYGDDDVYEYYHGSEGVYYEETREPHWEINDDDHDEWDDDDDDEWDDD
jgi:hypothetical protein